MKNKIFGILICMILIFAALIPIAGSFSLDKPQQLSPSRYDQCQNLTTQLYWLENGVTHWQQFKNLGQTLEKIELHFGQYYGGSSDVTVSIKKTLSGTALTSKTYPATWFTSNVQKWYTFDLPDVPLQQGKIYYIVIEFGPSSEYGWSGETGDPYPAGGSSNPDPDWDYAFRTIVDKSKSKDDAEPTPVTDQEQPICDDCAFLYNYGWQEFIPKGKTLQKVVVCLAQWFGGSPDITLSIESPLGNSLGCSVSLPASAINSGTCDWVTFDVPDIRLNAGDRYFIVVSYPLGGEYGWCGAYGNPYTPGTSDKDPDWDYTFRTIVDKSKPKLNVLDLLIDLMNRFPILNQLIKL